MLGRVSSLPSKQDVIAQTGSRSMPMLEIDHPHFSAVLFGNCGNLLFPKCLCQRKVSSPCLCPCPFGRQQISPGAFWETWDEGSSEGPWFDLRRAFAHAESPWACTSRVSISSMHPLLVENLARTSSSYDSGEQLAYLGYEAE